MPHGNTHFFVVNGPGSAGKSTLILRLLGANRARFLSVVRLREDPTIATPRGADQEAPELQGMRAAGAEVALTVFIPPRRLPRFDEIVDHIGMLVGLNDAVVFEGGGPLARHADLRIFVTRPLPPGEPLLSESHEEVHRLDQARYLRTSLGDTGGLAPLEVPDLAGEGMPDELSGRITQVKEHTGSAYQHLWRTRKGYEQIATAQLVVVNIHHESERPHAERLLDEVRHLQRDDAVFYGLPPSANHSPRNTLCVACLADKQDEGTRRAIDRIQRAIERT